MTRFTYYFKKHSFIQLIPNVGSALSQALGSKGEWTEYTFILFMTLAHYSIRHACVMVLLGADEICIEISYNSDKAPRLASWWWSELPSCPSCVTLTPLSLGITVATHRYPVPCQPSPPQIPSAPLPKLSTGDEGQSQVPTHISPPHFLSPQGMGGK